MRSVRVLVKADVRRTRNRLFGAGSVRSRRWVAGLVILPLFIVAVFCASWFGGYVLGMQSGPTALNYVTLGFTSLLVAQAVFNFGPTLDHFFASDDLPLLLTAPISLHSVLIARLLRALPSAGTPGLVLFGGAMGLGIGLDANVPVLFLVLSTLVISFMLAGSALEVIAVSLLLQRVPVRQLKAALSFVSALFGLGGFALQFLARGGNNGATARFVSGELTMMAQPDWSPPQWAANALMAASAGRFVASAGWTLLVVITATAIIAIAARRYELSLGQGLTGLGPAADARTRAVVRRRAAPSLMPWRAILRKDLRTLRRDPRRVASALPGVIFGAAYPLLSLRPGAHVISGSVGFAFLGLPFLSAINLGSLLADTERPGVMVLLASPVSRRTIVAAKLGTLAVFTTTISLVIVLGYSVVGLRSALPLPAMGALVAWLAFAMTIVAGAVHLGAVTAGPAPKGLGGIALLTMLAGEAGILFFTGLAAAGAWILWMASYAPTTGPALIHRLPISALVIFGAAAMVLGVAGLVSIPAAMVSLSLRRLARLEPGQ